MKTLYQYLLTCLLCQILVVNQIIAQVPDIAWAKQSNSTSSVNSETGRAVASDAAGNTYVTGQFENTIKFGDVTLTSSEGSTDVFVAKYDASGTVVWARQAGSGGSDIGYGIAVDGAGNAYVVGQYAGRVSFGGTTLTSSGGTDIFIVKYSAAGNVLWAKQAGSSGNDTGYAIAVDWAGNAYITGSFAESAIFGNHRLTSKGNTDVFIAQYDATGNVLWAKAAGGKGYNYGRSIAIDGSGNAYINGDFTGQISFGDIELTSKGYNDIFIAKYDKVGNELWAQRAGGEFMDMGNAITVDNAGNAYITGYFMMTAAFGDVTLTGVGFNQLMYLAKYDTSGKVVWAKKTASSLTEIGYGVAVDKSDNVYVTGEYWGSPIFGSTRLDSKGAKDAFVVMYKANGTVSWARSAGSPSSQVTGYGIAVDHTASIYITGEFTLGASFAGITISDKNGYGISYNIFITKYNAHGTVQWARHPVATGANSIGKSIAVDGSGNTYATGEYYGTIAFANTKLTSTGATDIFLVKYDEKGDVVWARTAGGPNMTDVAPGVSVDGSDRVHDIAVDGSGHIYIVGEFTRTASFGVAKVSSSGSTDMFLAKYDDTGNVVWVKSAGSTGTDIGYSVAVDDAGNAYVTGLSGGGMKFGDIAPAGSGRAFIAKYDASGKELWAKLAGNGSGSGGKGIATSKDGHLYLTGEIFGTATFGNTTVTSSGLHDIFVTKYDLDGNEKWAKLYGGAGSSELSAGVVTDDSGNIYITGNYSGPTVLGDKTLTSQGDNDVFLVKCNPAGDVLWAQVGGGGGIDAAYGVAVDNGGSAYITGSFSGTSIFEDEVLPNRGFSATYVVKYDESGYLQWSKALEGANRINGRGIAVDAVGNAYVAGVMRGSAAWSTSSLNASGLEAFVVKINHAATPTGISSPEMASAAILLYPNPTYDIVQLALTLPHRTSLSVKILDIKGKAVFIQDYGVVVGDFSNTLNLRHLTAGMYLLQIETNNRSYSKRLLKK